MRKYYICRDFSEACGISKYGYVFFSTILKEYGFEKIHLKDVNDVSQVLSKINCDDKVWIEIGLGTYLETLLYKKLIRKNNQNVIITLHDAPFIEYPILKFKNQPFNLLSKINQYVFLRWPFTSFFYSYLHKTKRIYTLNPKGTESLLNRYRLHNVVTIPHVLHNIEEVDNKKSGILQFLYFGFIGKNKGLEYALSLHEKINTLVKTPITMKIIGKTLDEKSEKYFQKIKRRYNENVEYLGYVEDKELDILMQQDNIILLPTKNYKVIKPTSGSVLNSLKYLNIVFTTKVNANECLISDKENGFFLQGDINS
ncbi:glycosyltransferase, partial [Escherichia coli]|nr:glycosyltransferase [Escherichia coli]